VFCTLILLVLHRRSLFADLNPSERQALADLQGDSNVASDTDGLSQGATVDDIDVDLLRQRTDGDKAFFEEIRETLQPLYVRCIGIYANH